MQKYRPLTKNELVEFEKEFISFLVVNGIEAKEWEKIKKHHTGKAEKILGQFSDVIFESILRKNMFLEFVTKNSIKCFQFLEHEVILVGIDAEPKMPINFLGEQSLDSIIINNSNHIKVYHSKKKYLKVREAEMFDMLDNGAELSKGKLFKYISLLL